MVFPKNLLMFPADLDAAPGFSSPTPGTAQENPGDEVEILTDQDVTNPNKIANDDQMGAITNSLEPLEDEPAEFMRGEVDVKEQMDRAADAMDASIHGWESQSDEDSPRGDLGASFKETPGGLEEVIEKTDEDLAHLRHKPHHH